MYSCAMDNTYTLYNIVFAPLIPLEEIAGEITGDLVCMPLTPRDHQ